MDVVITEHRVRHRPDTWHVTHRWTINGEQFVRTHEVPNSGDEPHGGHLGLARARSEHYFRSQLQFEFRARPVGMT